MKQLISKYQIPSFDIQLKSLLCIAALAFFSAGCNFKSNTDGIKQQITQNAPAVNQMPDSVEQTGNAQLDSLLHAIMTAKQDTDLAKLYNSIGDRYAENDFEKAKEYYTRLKNLSETLNWDKGFYLYASGLSITLIRQGLIDSALIINRQALDLAKKENDEEWVNVTKSHIGESYAIKRWNETALQYYLEVLPYFEKKNDKKRLKDIYFMIGNVYQNINNLEKAIYYGEKSVAYSDNDPYNLFGLGQAYSYAHQYEKAKSYYKKALNICIQQNNVYLTAAVYDLLGADALVTYDLNNSEIYLNKSLEMSKQIGSMSSYLGALISFGKLEEIKGNFAKSEKYVNEALPLTIEYNNNDGENVCYMMLAELSVIQHKYQDNMRYWVKLDSLEIAKANDTSLRSAEEMSAKYETEKKELQITALKKERELIIWLGIAGSTVLLFALTTFILLLRGTIQKRKLAESRIKQLE